MWCPSTTPIASPRREQRLRAECDSRDTCAIQPFLLRRLLNARSPGPCPELPSVSKSMPWNCSLAVERVELTRDFTADTRIGVPADHAIADYHIVARNIVAMRRHLTRRLAMRVPGDSRGCEQRDAKSGKDQLRVE